MKIEFSRQKAFLENVNPRSEFHGEERKPAGDITISVEVHNNALAHFHPTLKSALYFNDSARPKDLADQGLEENPDHLPHLRMPNLGSPLKWKDEMVGGVFTVHYGVDGRSDLVFPDVKVNNLTVTAKEGGTCEIGLRVQCHPDEAQFGKLCGSGMIQSQIEISLKAPVADAIL
jgi:hypothetical protein